VLPMLKEVMNFAEFDKLKDSVINLGSTPRAPLSSSVTSPAVPPLMPKTPVAAPAAVRTRPSTES